MAAAELVQGYEMMAKDQGLGLMFGKKQRYEMLHDVSKLKGFTRFSAYLDQNAPDPQPDPFKTRELDIKDKVAQAQLGGLNIKQQDASRLYALDQSKLEQHSQDMQLKSLDHDRTHDRQDAETTARIQTAEEQLKIEQQLADNDKAKIAVSASVNPRP
jgi:hypothetical protein